MKEMVRTKKAEETDLDILEKELTPDLPAVPEEAPLSTVKVINSNAALHGGDSPVTYLKLAQGTSSEGTPGMFISSSTSEEHDEVRMVPIKIQPVRTLWPKEFSRDRNPDCASDDGVFAVTSFFDGSSPAFPGAPCSRCEFFVPKPWMAEPGQRLCQAGYIVYGLSLDTFEVVSLRLQGTSTKIARLLARPGVFGRQVVRLYSQKKTSDRGSWYQMMAEACGPVTTEEGEEVQEILAEYAG
jgi:hypothetical protein